MFSASHEGVMFHAQSEKVPLLQAKRAQLLRVLADRKANIRRACVGIVLLLTVVIPLVLFLVHLPELELPNLVIMAVVDAVFLLPLVLFTVVWSVLVERFTDYRWAKAIAGVDMEISDALAQRRR